MWKKRVILPSFIIMKAHFSTLYENCHSCVGMLRLSHCRNAVVSPLKRRCLTDDSRNESLLCQRTSICLRRKPPYQKLFCPKPSRRNLSRRKLTPRKLPVGSASLQRILKLFLLLLCWPIFPAVLTKPSGRRTDSPYLPTYGGQIRHIHNGETPEG